MPAQTNRLGIARPVDFLVAFGQRNEAGWLLAQEAKHLQGRIQLSLAAVDQQNIRKYRFLAPALAVAIANPPRDNLADRREIIHAGYRLDAKPAIARLERQAVDERHQRRHRLVAAQMG